jgi:hypothetical protein
MNDTNATMNSMDSLLDATLDDLADLPEFLPFPPGLHTCVLNFTTKKVNTKTVVDIKLTAVETVELADPSATPLTRGATCNVSYFIDNVYAQGALKKIAQSLQAHFTDAKSLSAIMREAEGCTCNVVTKQRPNKDKSQVYTDIVELQVA